MLRLHYKKKKKGKERIPGRKIHPSHRLNIWNKHRETSYCVLCTTNGTEQWLSLNRIFPFFQSRPSAFPLDFCPFRNQWTRSRRKFDLVCYDSRELVSARMFELLVGHSWILTIMLGYIAVNRSRVAFCLLCWNFSLYIPDNPTYSALLSLEWRKISWSTITSYNMSPFQYAITNANSNNNNITSGFRFLDISREILDKLFGKFIFFNYNR